MDESDLRRRKLMIQCGFCARGECKFEAAALAPSALLRRPKIRPTPTMSPTAQIARGETLAWPGMGSAMRTTGGRRRAAEVAASAATKGHIIRTPNLEKLGNEDLDEGLSNQGVSTPK